MPEIAPRTVWACQPVPAIIWAMVAPPGWRIASMIDASLVPGRMVRDVTSNFWRAWVASRFVRVPFRV